MTLTGKIDGINYEADVVLQSAAIGRANFRTVRATTADIEISAAQSSSA